MYDGDFQKEGDERTAKGTYRIPLHHGSIGGKLGKMARQKGAHMSQKVCERAPLRQVRKLAVGGHTEGSESACEQIGVLCGRKQGDTRALLAQALCQRKQLDGFRACTEDKKIVHSGFLS